MKTRNLSLLAAASLIAGTTAAIAQTPAPAAPASGAPTSVSIYFNSGSYAILPADAKKLDEASRIFNDGKPIVMIVTGMADGTGDPAPNLLLSQRRADAVFAGLVARGLPPDHFQILAKGESEALTGKEPNGVADQHFRKVEITWR
jgi:outer membrane protein OmpA-like peptidoglycan-associated protein